MLPSGLIHRPWPPRLTILIEPRSWHLKLQALSVEHLVVVESRRCGIETDALASHALIITCTSAFLLPALIVLDASDLILDAEDRITVIHVLSLIRLGDNLSALAVDGLQESHTWIMRVQLRIEAILC